MQPETTRRRRRVRHAVDAAPAVTTVVEDAVPVPEPTDGDVASERGLRGLIGGGSSQVNPSMAMRARDAARAVASDLARAEADLVIVRRNWTPRD
jgi:hypothetical protein